jgi:hypothetical protein
VLHSLQFPDGLRVPREKPTVKILDADSTLTVEHSKAGIESTLAQHAA